MERKLIFLHQLIVACRQYHSGASRQQRLGMTERHNNQENVVEQQHHLLQPAVKKPSPNGVEICSDDDEIASRSKLQIATAPVITVTATTTTTTGKKRSVIYADVPQEEQPRPLPEQLMCVHDDARKALGGAAAAASTSAGEEETTAAFEFHPSPLHNFGQATEDDQQYSGGDSNNSALETPPVEGAPLGYYSNTMMKTETDEVPSFADSPHHLTEMFQDLENRVSRIEIENEGAQEATNTIQQHVLAHLRVLEGRILAVERRQPVHLVPKEQQQQEQQQQTWTRWNSPTACFNPLYSATTPPQPQQNEETGSPGVMQQAFPKQDSVEQAEEKRICGEDECALRSRVVLRALSARLQEAQHVLKDVRRALV